MKNAGSATTSFQPSGSCNTRLASAAGSFSDDANAKAGAMKYSQSIGSVQSEPTGDGRGRRATSKVALVGCGCRNRPHTPGGQGPLDLTQHRFSNRRVLCGWQTSHVGKIAA
jgi:hypothetical protein